MNAKFTADEILEATSGQIVSGTKDDKSGSICSNIDELEAGQWFLAVPEPHRDGHDALKEAAEKGAIGAIVVRRRRYPFAAPDALMLGVDSTLQAYYQLARLALKRIKPKVIAITGSSGKSTTRDMLKSILSLRYKVHTSSTNKPDGRNLARTILSMPEDTEVLVVELAQKGRGQISWLGSMIEPDIAIITNIGQAHLDTLGSMENVAQAKCELLETINAHTGIAILGDQNHHLVRRAQVVLDGAPMFIFDENDIDELAVTPEHTIFASRQNTLFELQAHGSAYLRDAWCAITCAKQLLMSEHQAAEGLRRYVPPTGRGNRMKVINDGLLIDESYSATPDSVRAAVSAFLDRRAVPSARKFIVLGAMDDLGESSDSLHRKLGSWLSAQTFEGLLLLGENTKHIKLGLEGCDFEVHSCHKASEVMSFLEKTIDQSTAILVDGSDSPELRTLVHGLTRQQAIR